MLIHLIVMQRKVFALLVFLIFLSLSPSLPLSIFTLSLSLSPSLYFHSLSLSLSLSPSLSLFLMFSISVLLFSSFAAEISRTCVSILYCISTLNFCTFHTFSKTFVRMQQGKRGRGGNQKGGISSFHQINYFKPEKT